MSIRKSSALHERQLMKSSSVVGPPRETNLGLHQLRKSENFSRDSGVLLPGLQRTSLSRNLYWQQTREPRRTPPIRFSFRRSSPGRNQMSPWRNLAMAPQKWFSFIFPASPVFRKQHHWASFLFFVGHSQSKKPISLF